MYELYFWIGSSLIGVLFSMFVLTNLISTLLYLYHENKNGLVRASVWIDIIHEIRVLTFMVIASVLGLSVKFDIDWIRQELAWGLVLLNLIVFVGVVERLFDRHRMYHR